MIISSDKLVQTLKNLKASGYTTLLSVVCTDISTNNSPLFRLDYTVFNSKNKEILTLETTCSYQTESVCALYKSANFDEREIYDLFGIKFLSHPNLKRLLLPDDFMGHPMCHNYKEEDERLIWNK